MDIVIVLFAVWIGFSLGVAYGRWLSAREKRRSPGARSMRLVTAYAYTSPATLEPDTDSARWATYLASFGLQCALAGVTSERAVVAAGIVAGEVDYRAYARLLRRYGVWYCRGARYKVRWLDRRPLVGVGRLRDAILRGRVVPHYPSPTPPPVFAVSGAHGIADVADFAEFQTDTRQ